MSANYNVDYFINKFQAIPEEKWISGAFINAKGNCCALGHCGARGNGNKNNEELNALLIISASAHSCMDTINDGQCNSYRQETPKKRVLAFLMDIKKAQYPEITDPPVYIDNYVFTPIEENELYERAE